MRSRRRLFGACLAAVFAFLAVAGGVLVTWLPDCPGRCPNVANASHPAAMVLPAPEPARISVLPAPKSTGVSPAAPVRVSAYSGRLTSVSMVNESGTVIPGRLAADGLSWRPDEQLGYGRLYTMTISAQGPTGVPSTQTASFSTVSPDNQAQLYLRMSSGIPIADGGVYGIGAVISARFDEPIRDRIAAESRMNVRTAPPVSGSWNWIDDQTAHWRPERYYAPGTRVTIDAPMYGARLGNGVYGAQDESVSFVIGAAHRSVADDKTKQISVYDGDRLVRTMPTSMGMGGTETIGGTTLSFWTPPGIYSVLDKGNPVVMDSSTFGLPVNSRLGYKLSIPWATRISTDGIYLHQLNATIWAQGSRNLSHGCLNLSGENAEWFFNFSQPGDIVEVVGTGGPGLTLHQGGDWSVPYAVWRKGSALGV